MPTRSSEKGELVGSFEVGSFVGVEDHEVLANMKTSVNKPLTGIPTQYSQRVFGERFEVYKTKLGAHTNPHGEMVAVDKKWKGVQEPLNGTHGDMTSPSRSFAGQPASQPEGELTPLGVLKNMVDNIAGDVRHVNGWVKAALILGAVGVCGFIVGLASLISH
jgi:hypothetical protein